ncbi:SnoaL-domain-containing protein [Hypoxylon sp. FL0543]|nr:SnoaL-domain-containing protein [Hypoxylon sp. FL0543]
MAPSASELVATVRSWAECINEKRWDELPKYMHYPYNQNGKEYTTESFTAHVRDDVAPILGGDIRIHEDSLLVDERTHRVAHTLWLKFKSEVPFLGYPPTGRDVYLIEHGFMWFTDGKLSKRLFLINSEDIREQLANPDAEYKPSLMSEYPVPKSEIALSRQQLEEVLINYVNMFNARKLTEKGKYVHEPETLLNNNELACKIMGDTLAAIPDVQVKIETIVADEESQRVAVLLKFSGTPIKEYDGLVANGRPVLYTEHATYQFLDGKIQRIWGARDLNEAKRQQQESPVA